MKSCICLTPENANVVRFFVGFWKNWVSDFWLSYGFGMVWKVLKGPGGYKEEFLPVLVKIHLHGGEL